MDADGRTHTTLRVLFALAVAAITAVYATAYACAKADWR